MNYYNAIMFCLDWKNLKRQPLNYYLRLLIIFQLKYLDWT